MRVAIIGSSGAKADANQFTEELYSKMIERCEEELVKLGEQKIDLVSGGSSWSDHMAVVIFLKSRLPDYPVKIRSLSLYLPSYWDRANGKFYDSYYGDILNKLHRSFSEEIYGGSSRQTLQEINTAITWHAQVFDHYDGFYDRNIEVGKVDLILAFTFGTLDLPRDGGTLHTWENSAAPQKIHVSLEQMVCGGKGIEE